MNMKIKLAAAAVAALSLSAHVQGLACLLPMALIQGCSGKDKPAEDNPDSGKTGQDGLEDISSITVTDDLTAEMGGTFTLKCSGVETSDHITFRSRADGTRYSATVRSAGDGGVTFGTPDSMFGGMYEVIFEGKQGTYSLGTVYVDLIDSFEVPKVSGRTLYGRVISADGKPLSGVAVSDGVFVTQTDADGCWYLSSQKKRGYVFVSLPSGYCAPVRNSVPQFFRRLTGKSSDYEMCNFILKKEDNGRHRIFVFTDTHLANRTDDVYQFENGFKQDIRKAWAEASSEKIPIYALALGDLAWDEYWYRNSYTLENYSAQMADVDMPVFSIPGNHDNDPYTADDFSAESDFRKNIGPTYYSMNIGDIHYVMMDDTEFINDGGSQGVVGSLNYSQGFTDDQWKWLEADMKTVPGGMMVFLGTHIQYSSRYNVSSGSLSHGWSMPQDQREKFVEIMAGHPVHIVSGHTHINYTNYLPDNIIEHNTAAVCATWWHTGKYTGGKLHVCRDGSPGGYQIFDMAADGSIGWHYQGIGNEPEFQFRAYDLNNCLISREKYCPDIKDDFSKVSADFFSQYANGYDAARSDNAVLINVFNWNEKWTVNVLESGTGKTLVPVQVDRYDPLHTILFNMNRMNQNSTSMTFPTLLTSHMFEVTCSSPTSSIEITVTDQDGKEYRQTMERPMDLSHYIDN